MTDLHPGLPTILELFQAYYDCRASAPVVEVRNAANSYFGILRQANAWRERSRIGDLLRRHGHIVALQNHRMFTERIPL